MIILGLHFGHDASVSIIRDGEVLLNVERERVSRIKHAISLSAEDVRLCLEDAGVGLEEIDYCTVTSTQYVEYAFVDPSKLKVTFEPHEGHRLPCTLVDRLHVTPAQMNERKVESLRWVVRNAPKHIYFDMFPDAPAYVNDDERFFGAFESFITLDLWSKRRSLRDVSRTDYSPLLQNDEVSYGFHYPVTVELLGRRIAGYVCSHHYAHAAYAFYKSPFGSAAILSHDGGPSYMSGLFAYGRDNRLYPWAPNWLAMGETYEFAALAVGLGGIGSTGKLMGLAAYGKPRFYSPDFVGNHYDAGRRHPREWIKHCVREATSMGYDLTPMGDRRRLLEPVNVDIAASTQRLVEETMVFAANSLHQALAGSGVQTSDLCLSGGVALNCPANTRIREESAFRSTFIPPAVGDGGLATGSALALYYNVLGNPRHPRPESPSIAYLGLNASASEGLLRETLDRYAERVSIEPCDAAVRAAGDVADDRVIGWFEGRSEVGPRALGHRSILANPAIARNWARVNAIKGREEWRPFAPAVPEEDADRFFGGVAFPSYFMLLNASVRSTKLPAITHRDGSARVQTVSAEVGEFHRLLAELGRRTGVPVVLNTSFNGPGEPIVETPGQALEFLLRTNLDAVYFKGLRVTRR